MVLLPEGEPARRDPPLGTPNQVRIPSPTSSVPTLDAESLQGNITSRHLYSRPGGSSEPISRQYACKQIMTAAQKDVHEPSACQGVCD